MTTDRNHLLSFGEAATAAELAGREKAGLPPHHCLDWPQFPFAFAHEEVEHFHQACADAIAQNPEMPEIQAALGYALLCKSNYAGASEAFARAGVMSLPPLGETSPRLMELPPVRGKFPERSGFFVGCDRRYLEGFVRPLLNSLTEFLPDHRIHIHYMGEPTEPKALIKSFPKMSVTVTQEDPTAFIAAHGIPASHYFGAARLVRFAEALNNNSGPLWMSDADALFHRNPKAMFVASGDMAMRIRPGRVEPWHQFSACLLMGRPAARAYFNRVADIVANALPRAFWGLDQFALFSAWIGITKKPQVTLLGPRETDVGACDDGSILWFTAGARKSRLFAVPRPADPSKFELEFWRRQG